MKTTLAKIGILLFIVFGAFLPAIFCPVLYSFMNRPTIKSVYKEHIETLLVWTTAAGLFGLICSAGMLFKTWNLLYIIHPVTNVGILILLLVRGLWNWLTPLAEVVKVTPEDSETLCRPYIPVVPCKMEASATTNEEAKV